MDWKAAAAAAEDMGPKTNEDKTKYMVTGKSTISSSIISVRCYNFQQLESFIYLGIMVNSEGDVTMVIKKRLGAAHKCYFSLKMHLSSNLLSCKVKCIIYKTNMPVLIYGSKTWNMGKHGENLLKSFERNVVKKIFGPVLENGF
jgi:hypothetical protein